MCPRCEKFRLVYDCPAEACQVKGSAAQVCRACTFCIARCAQCGRCISDNEYEETFCLDLLCSDCFKQVLKCQDRLDKRVVDDAHGVITNQVITPEVRVQTYDMP
ncbi:F-box protein skip14 [Phtheirospermum japonicum]|uniref:F-box protein skip14 n=1 Tax=Phtheirospermum japonicum TaxID=374723 RepID=A0A830BWW3_9LAMI|nr:F-box protein skip14 [Phtheirospermum japonicum]